MGNIVYCRACGKEIMFIKTSKGKSMPVNPDARQFCPDLNGPDLYVLTDGSVLRGADAREEDKDKHIGFISHFATCTNPDDFRKKKPRKKDRKGAEK